jgi:chorismate-pyruvate lyase
MSPDLSQALAREPFLAASTPTAELGCQRRILDLLLAQDGSTTRLCETVAGGPVELHVMAQARVPWAARDVPAVVQAALPDSPLIERCTCLASRGSVMMDNLAYIAVDRLPAALRNELEAGKTPIGHILGRLWIRREPMAPDLELLGRLWRVVGVPDVAASRCYAIVGPEGRLMVIAETFRRGMLVGGAPASAR